MPNYKVVNSDQLDSDITVVADAIREKSGASGKLAFPNGMADAVRNIQSGGTELPELDNPGTASDLTEGKQLIDANGNVVEGTLREEVILQISKNVRVETDDGTIEMVAPVTKDCILRDGAYSRLIAASSAFGNASPSDVAKGVTFTSTFGVKVEGTHECESGITLPTLTNPASPEDMVTGKELYDDQGNKISGSVYLTDRLMFSKYAATEDGIISSLEADVDEDWLTLTTPPNNNFRFMLERGGIVEAGVFLSDLGDVQPGDVVEGKTFTSAAGLKVPGTLPTPNGETVEAVMAESIDDTTFYVEGVVGEDVLLRKGKFMGAYVDTSKVGDFGTATPADVTRGKTFTSSEGYALLGTMEAESGGDTSSEDGLVTRTLTSYSNDRVTTVGDSAFLSYTNLTHVSFPNVTEVKRYAFRETGLKTFYFPKLKSIGEYSFRTIAAERITAADLPAWDGTITGQYAFATNQKLKYFQHTFTKPLGMRALMNSTGLNKVDFCTYGLKEECFSGCSALTTLILRRSDTICELNATTVFTNTPIAKGTGYIYVPSALIEEYKVATNWSTYADQFRAIEDYPEICEVGV